MAIWKVIRRLSTCKGQNQGIEEIKETTDHYRHGVEGAVLLLVRVAGDVARLLVDECGHVIHLRVELEALEDDEEGLREAHDEDDEDGEESCEVLGQHPVDHDDHGPDQLEAPAEEEEVGTGGQHHWAVEVVMGEGNWCLLVAKSMKIYISSSSL